MQRIVPVTVFPADKMRHKQFTFPDQSLPKRKARHWKPTLDRKVHLKEDEYLYVLLLVRENDPESAS